jgi:C4-dicarboxylate-specific signal transduction histidine kinase
LSRDTQGRIDIGLSKGGDGKVLVTVKDNGGGIPDEIIDRIFNTYFTTKAGEKGTGIGLYISKTIIEDMGGALTARNVNGGAEFTISLDVRKSEGTLAEVQNG